MSLKLLLALAALVFTPTAQAGEWEVVDRLTVGGSTILVGSVTVVNSTLTVSGSDSSGYSLGLSSGIDTPNGTIVAGMFAGNGSRITNISYTDAARVSKNGDNMTGFLNVQTASMTVAYNVGASSAVFGTGTKKSSFTATGALQLAFGSTITTNGGTLAFSTNTEAASSNFANIFFNGDGNIGFGGATAAEINQSGASGPVVTFMGSAAAPPVFELYSPITSANSNVAVIRGGTNASSNISTINTRTGIGGSGNTDGAFTVALASVGTSGEIFRLEDGNAGIGAFNTNDPGYALDIIGNMRATGSVYYAGTIGNADGVAYTKPDFVFQPGYVPLGIDAVEKFIKKEGHLPWLTPAKDEEKEDGIPVVDMTRMNFQTVETVENLQLQAIALNKIIKELTAADEKKRARLIKLEEQVKRLRKQQ